MADDEGAGGAKTFTQEEVDSLTAGLKANRDSALDEAKTAKRDAASTKEALAAFKDIDPDTYKELVNAAAESDRTKAKGAGEWDKLEGQLVEKHATELEQLVGKHTEASEASKAKEAKLTNALENRLKQAELTTAIAEKGGDVKLLLPHAMNLVRVRETDDDYEAYVVDGSGAEQFADGQMTKMSFGELVDTLIEQYPRAFDGTGSSGGGASKSTGGASGSSKVVEPDSLAYFANLEKIAKGEEAVQDA